MSLPPSGSVEREEAPHPQMHHEHHAFPSFLARASSSGGSRGTCLPEACGPGLPACLLLCLPAFCFSSSFSGCSEAVAVGGLGGAIKDCLLGGWGRGHDRVGRLAGQPDSCAAYLSASSSSSCSERLPVSGVGLDPSRLFQFGALWAWARPCDRMRTNQNFSHVGLHGLGGGLGFGSRVCHHSHPTPQAGPILPWAFLPLPSSAPFLPPPTLPLPWEVLLLASGHTTATASGPRCSIG